MVSPTVVVRWLPSPDRVTVYRIFRAVGTGAFAQISSVTGVMYTDKAVRRGLTYHYFVEGVMNGVASKPSNVASIKP